VAWRVTGSGVIGFTVKDPPPSCFLSRRVRTSDCRSCAPSTAMRACARGVAQVDGSENRRRDTRSAGDASMTLTNFCALVRAGIAVWALSAAANARAETVDMQAWIGDKVANREVLAVTAVHYDDGEVRHFHGGTLAPGSVAEPDAETGFQMGSITKAFTDLLLAEMVAAGKLDYDTTIGSLLGDSVEFANPAVAEITLQQLATHTSGLPRLPANLVPTNPLDPYAGYDEAALLRGLAASRDRQPLGNHYAYSNFGVGVLGYLLGRAHGGGYRAALEEWVLEPLALEQTGFDAPAEIAAGYRNGQVVPAWNLDALGGAGALWGSTADFVRLARVQLGVDANPLEHDLAADREVVTTGPAGFDVTRVWHAADAGDGTIYWHNGGTGGYWSFFGFRPATNEAVAILVSGDPDVTQLGLRWLGYSRPSVEPPRVDKTLFGQYQLAPGVGIGVYGLNGGLVAQLSGQQPLPLSALEDDWYAIDVADASLRFVREDGVVVAVELAQNGRLQRALRVADVAATLARDSIDLSRDKLAEYVGEYPINGAVKFIIRLGDEGLEAQITGQPFLPIFAKGDDVFFYKVVDAELHFERGDAGAVEALVLYQGNITQRAVKSD
jgi:CubicO group peptidase (beta-lactamase class C family)